MTPITYMVDIERLKGKISCMNYDECTNTSDRTICTASPQNEILRSFWRPYIELYAMLETDQSTSYTLNCYSTTEIWGLNKWCI